MNEFWHDPHLVTNTQTLVIQPTVLLHYQTGFICWKNKYSCEVIPPRLLSFPRWYLFRLGTRSLDSSMRRGIIRAISLASNTLAHRTPDVKAASDTWQRSTGLCKTEINECLEWAAKLTVRNRGGSLEDEIKQLSFDNAVSFFFLWAVSWSRRARTNSKAWQWSAAARNMPLQKHLFPSLMLSDVLHQIQVH